MEPLRPGDPRAVGPWKVLSRIGAGGMGVVYYAHRDGQLVALKVVRDLDGTERNIVQYFKRELANLRLVSGPCVASLIDADMDSDPAWIAFEFVEGKNLKVFLESEGPMSEQAWAKFASGLLEGIVQVHAAGVVHRDLKPTNIVMSANGPKLIDFGIAQSLDDTPFTRTGLTVGTPTWMAPEQVNSRIVGQPADLFAAGSVLLYAATGREPWGTGTVGEIQARILRATPDLTGVATKQRRLISALLLKDPMRRPSAAGALGVLAGSVNWNVVPWRKVFFASAAGALVVIGLVFWFSFGIEQSPVVLDVIPLSAAATKPAAVEVVPVPSAIPAEPIAFANPLPAPTPLVATVPVAVVQSDRLNVREEPVPNSPVVFVAQRNDTLYITGAPTGSETIWLPVYGVDKGKGWVAQRFVVREERPATEPDYAIWLDKVCPLTIVGCGRLARERSVISATNTSALHQAGLIRSGDTPLSIDFSPDGVTLASGSADGTVKLWAVPSGLELYSLAGHNSGVTSVAFSPDGNTLASGSADYSVKLWDVKGRREYSSLLGHTGIIVSVAFSPDGRTLASTSLATSTNKSDRVRLWDVKTGGALGIVDAPMVNGITFAPDGKTLATGGVGAEPLRIWNVDTRQVVRIFDGKLFIWSVAFSPDGTKIAAVADGTTVRLWDVATGGMLRIMSGHTDLVHDLAFSPDGNTLVSASADTTIKLWEVASGRELRSLNGHSGIVNSVMFSPDGKVLASGSADGSIRLWDNSEVLPLFALDKLEEKPLRWDPCAGPIRVAVNFGSLLAEQRKQVDVIMARSIETLRRHSGLEFVYAGASLRRAANEFREGRRGNEAILLDFVPSDELSGNVLENSFPSIDPLGSSRVWWALESADIKMDAQMDGFFWPNHGWGDELVLRRLLEVSGLRGVNSQYEVMNIPLNASERYRMTEFFNMNLELGPGDILGLHAVGAEQGCIVD